MGVVRYCWLLSLLAAVLSAASWPRLATTGIKLAALGIWGPFPNSTEAMQLLSAGSHHFQQSASFVVMEKAGRPSTPWVEVLPSSLLQAIALRPALS